MPGGSHIEVGGVEYTFGAIGFDFYYSGELAEAFPFRRERFVQSDHVLTTSDIEEIQSNMSDCARPEKGLEYRRDSTPQEPVAPVEPPDPFGIDHSKVKPMEHTAQ